MPKATLSDIFGLYERALGLTRGRLDSRVIESTRELEEFYKDFLTKHVARYADLFSQPAVRREIHRILEERHHTRSLRFWAIDGACQKIETSDLAIFYGGAYVVKGELGLQDNPPSVTYRESEPDDDSSLVAYLPLSPEDLTVIDAEDRFVVDDAERISISGLDTNLMLLAEVFMCYRGASSPDHPHLVLWDHSLSSVLANATPNIRDLRLAGFSMAGETVWHPDLLVAFSKPWNRDLDVPGRKTYRLWERAIAKMFDSDVGEVLVADLVAETGLPADKVVGQVAILWKLDRYGLESATGAMPADSLASYDSASGTIRIRPEYRHSDEKAKRLFTFFCNKFFVEKDPSVLLYRVQDEQGRERERFLSTGEIQFLLAIGLRLTFEACWRNGVMLVGVVKDSASTYFTNHFLGVMRQARPNDYDFEAKLIPPTDRLAFERVPMIDDSLEAPWGSEEFDGIFMTLRMKRDRPGSAPRMQGVRGDILLTPNLVMRSLVQFYLRRQPDMDLSMGHAIFIDRLVHADAQPPRIRVSDGDPSKGGDPNLGRIEPFVHEQESAGHVSEHMVMVYLLDVLTKNVFAEIIGYPDPLHYADRGAKSVLRSVAPMLQSSERLDRTNPIHKTVRQNRGG